MDKLFKKLLDHHKLVCVVFIILALVSTVIQGAVKVNTDFSSFLPESAPSTVGLHTMNEVFDQALPNVRMQVSDLGIGAALDLARELVDVPGVSSIMWLGSMADVRQPLETLDEGLLTAWTAEDGFLFSLAIAEGDDVEDTIAALRGLAEGSGGGAVYMDGQALANLQTRGSIGSELILVMGFAILLLLLVLSSTSDSWLEPLVFLVVIGAAILINLGTNIFKGEISMVTQMAASVLQLAVSIDYGIVLLHAYRHRKAEGLSPYDAMYAALKHAFPILLSSAAVTFFGFLSLVFMVLALGMDMGIVLSKGILISFICVSFFMPCLILWCQKPLERTRHRILLKRFGGFARVCSQLAIPATILVVLLAVPSFLGEKNLDFMYGSTILKVSVQRLQQAFTRVDRPNPMP
jgi:predicted RND superfamily exporter protein